MPFTPYDQARDTIDRARQLLATANTGGLPSRVPADLRRLAIVMGVAGLDTYMHGLVVTRAYDHAHELPGGLAALDIPFGEVLDVADETVVARRDGRAVRPRVRLKRILRDRLLRQTFQRSDDVSKALGMAGRSGQWEHIATAMPGIWTSQSLRAKLDLIVDRRNAIVHEGDYERLVRPQFARLNPVTAAEASGDLDFLAELVDAIHAVV